MNRRELLRRAAIAAGGAIAADQIELIEKLFPRTLFAGADFAPEFYQLTTYSLGFLITQEYLNDCLHSEFIQSLITRSNKRGH